MKAVVQRVLSASVTVDGKVVGKIDKGLLLLIGVKDDDTKKDAEFLAEKCCGLRVFEDENGKMNCSLSDVKGAILAISNFTVYGDCSHGKRPSFIKAAPPDKANELYEYFVSLCRQKGIETQTGIFRADMKVSLCNDGPITIIACSDHLKEKK